MELSRTERHNRQVSSNNTPNQDSYRWIEAARDLRLADDTADPRGGILQGNFMSWNQTPNTLKERQNPKAFEKIQKMTPTMSMGRINMERCKALLFS